MRRTSALEQNHLPNKHQQKTEATKRKLLDSALRVFARDGFDAARIEDIASDAGYTRGAFYANFQSKEELFFALLEDQSHKHFEQIRTKLAKCTTEEARQKALSEFYVKRARNREWSILTLEFKLYALRHPESRAEFAERHRSIRMKMKWETLEQAWPKELRCKPDLGDSRKLALQAMLNGLVLERAYDPAGLSEAQMEFVLRSVFEFLVT